MHASNRNPAGGRESGSGLGGYMPRPVLVVAVSVLFLVLLAGLDVGRAYLLSAAAALLGATLAVVATRQWARYERVARILERAFVPPVLPEMPGWETATLYVPATDASRVGGDFFDAFRTPDGWMVVVGDIGGHGVEAAALTAMARYTLRTAGSLTGCPASAVEQLDRWLREAEGMKTCTVVAVGLRTGGEVSIVSAGHPPPILVRAGEERGSTVDVHGSMLGVFDEPHWEPADLRLDSGDQLVLFTDGVTEAPCSEGRFGDGRLMRAVSGASEPEGAVGKVRAALDAAGAIDGADDMAVLAIMRTAFVSEGLGVSGEAELGIERERSPEIPVSAS